MRTTAISCAIACSAMVAGPGMAGTAVASADLFGVGGILDIFDHNKDKKNKKHSHRGATVSGQQNGGSTSRAGDQGSRRAPGFGPGPRRGGPDRSAQLGAHRDAQRGDGHGAGSNRQGRPSSADDRNDEQTGTANRSARSVDVPDSAVTGARITPPAVVAGGGGNGVSRVPTSGSTGRAPNLAPVPTAPSNRSVVIRAQPPAASAPSVPVAPVAPMPVVVPPVPLVPLAPVVAAPPGAPSAGAPAAPAAPSIPEVTPPSLTAPAAPAPNAVPASFRVGYADYLRTANNMDLLFAVLPGMAGLVLLTAAGGALGVRHARAAQAVPAPQIARFMP